MEFDHFLQAAIELNLLIGSEFVSTVDHFASKIDKIFFNIRDECNRKMTNGKINH